MISHVISGDSSPGEAFPKKEALPTKQRRGGWFSRFLPSPGVGKAASHNVLTHCAVSLGQVYMPGELQTLVLVTE